MKASAVSHLPQRSEYAPPRLRLYLLGGFRAEWDGQAVAEQAWQRRAAKALVKLLAIEPSHRLHRAQVIDLLWPEAPFESGLNSFFKALHSARRALQPTLSHGAESTYLRMTGDTLTLVAKHAWIDVDHFQLLAQKALDTRTLSDLEAAVAAYAGDLLPEDRYEQWATIPREELHERWLRLLAGLADALERQGSYGAAAERCRQILAVDPTREEVHRRLMRLHLLCGERHEALRQYETCRAVLQAELGVEPDGETEELYQQILSGKLARVGPGRQRSAPASGLPPAVRRSPAQRMVGRDRVLEILMSELEHAAEGNGGMVLLGGEAGVGKSRLAAEAAHQAHRRGALVLWGASYEQEGLLPYGPFVEALECYLTDRPAHVRGSMAEAYPELARLLPSLASGGEQSEGRVDSPGDRARLYGATVRLLSNLSADHAVLLVLEDLHAADTESLWLLHHLARSAEPRRWLIVATYREEEVAAGSGLQHLWTMVAREGISRRIDLGRLSRPDSQELVRALLPGGTVGPDVAAHLYAVSLGNPFFLQEMVQAMREQGALVSHDGSWQIRQSTTTIVPGQVRDLVAARIDRLSEGVRRTVALAATAGMDCSLSVLRAAATGHGTPPLLTERELLEALDQALEMRILEERGDGFAFAHPLLRATLYERLPRHRRLAFHAALAWATEQNRPEEVEALAYHYARSENQGNAMLYLERAGDRARARYAHEVAQSYYRELLARLHEQTNGSVSARAREKLGAELKTMARYDEALELLEQAAALYHRGEDLAGELRAVAEIGRVHFLRGTAEAGIAGIAPLLERLDASTPSPALGAVYAALASLYWASRRYTEQLATARRAAELARATQEEMVLAEAEQWHGYALLALQQVEEGMRILEGVIPLAEANGDLLTLSRALTGLAAEYSDRGQFEKERSYLEPGLQVAERLADPTRVAFMSYRIGINTYLSGDWTDSRRRLERAVAIGREIGGFRAFAETLFALGRLSLRQGDEEAAMRYLEESIVAGENSGNTAALRAAHSLLAEHDLQEGKPQAARARLDRLLARLGMREEEAGHLLPILAWTRLEEDAPEAAARARVLVEKSRAQATVEENRLLMVDALHVQALVAIKQERWDEAQATLEEALALTRAMHYAYAEARILQVYGTMWLRGGNQERSSEFKGQGRQGRPPTGAAPTDPISMASASGATADQLLQEALSILRRLGARLDALRVERDLAQLRSG